jgi:hypothetical protein
MNHHSRHPAGLPAVEEVVPGTFFLDKNLSRNLAHGIASLSPEYSGNDAFSRRRGIGLDSRSVLSPRAFFG